MHNSFLLFALIASPAFAGDARPAETVAISHVTVIDVSSGDPGPDQTVVIAAGKIEAVGPSDSTGIPNGARIVDGAGKFLIPGLWDMHVHFSSASSMPLFVANGVTGVRVMWGNASFGLPLGPYHQVWKKEIADGKRLGPRMVVASNMLDGPRPIWPGAVAISDPVQGRKAVRHAKAAGADFIKVYALLDKDAYLAIADESRVQSIPFVGHVPLRVGAGEASDAGQKSIEHLTGVFSACSSKRDELDRKRADLLRQAIDFVAHRDELEALDKEAIDTFDPEVAARLFGRFRKNGTRHCPTLTVLKMIARIDDPTLRDDPRMKYVDRFTRFRWEPPIAKRTKASTEVLDARLRNFRGHQEMVGRLHGAGVPILAGTDELNPFIFPGFSLHDELALLVESGLSPLAAIRAATLEPARFLGLDSTLGTISPGKDADLVLLDADPLLDIRNTTKIQAVVVRGRLLDRAALDAMLAEAEATAAGKRARN